MKISTKKLLLTLFVAFISIVFLGCGNDADKEEALKSESLFIGDVNVLTADLELPTKTTKYGFEVVWTVECADNSIEIVQRDGKTIAKVNRLEYTENESGVEIVRWGRGKLVGTISNKSGSRSFEFPYAVRSLENVVRGLTLSQLKQTKLMLNGEEINAKGAMIEAKGTVIGVGKSGFYIHDASGSFYIFTSETPSVNVGEIVTVVGKRDTYYSLPQITKDPAPVITVTGTEEVNYDSISEDLSIKQILAKEYTTETPDNFTLLVKTKGRISKTVVSDEDVYWITDELTGSKTRFEISYGTAKDALTELDGFVGKYIELTTIIYDYHSQYKLPRVVYLKGLGKEIEAPVLTDEIKFDNIKEELKDTYEGKSYYDDVELLDKSSLYEDATITWVSNNTDVLGNDGKYTVPNAPTQVELTATITIGEKTDTVKINVTVEKLPESTVSQAYAKEKGKTICVRGIVSTIIFGGFYITDGAKSMVIYKPNVTPKVGETVVVVGTKDEYKGCVQLASGAVVTVDTTVQAKTTEELVALLAPEVKTIAELNAMNNLLGGQAFKVKGTLSGPQSYTYTLTDGEDTLTIKNIFADVETPFKKFVNKADSTFVLYVYSTDDGVIYTYVQDTAAEKELTPAEKMDYVKTEVETLLNSYNGFTDIELPTSYKGTTITWASNNQEVITTNGKVTHPSTDTEVELTATIKLEGQTDVVVTKKVTVKVIKPTTIKAAIAAIDDATDNTIVCFTGKVVGLTCDGFAYIADSTAAIYVRGKGLKVDDIVTIVGNGTVYTSSGNEYTRQIDSVLYKEDATEQIEVVTALTDLDATALKGINVDNKVNKDGIKAATFANQLVKISGKVVVGKDKYSYLIVDEKGNTLFNIYHYSQMFNNNVNDTNEFNKLNNINVEIEGFIISYSVSQDAWKVAVTKLTYNEEDLTPVTILVEGDFSSLANKTASSKWIADFNGWSQKGNMGQSYAGAAGFARSGDSESSLITPVFEATKEFEVTVSVAGQNSENGSYFKIEAIDKDGNVVASGICLALENKTNIEPSNTKTKYVITFNESTFVSGKTFTDVAKVMITYHKETGNLALYSLKVTEK